MKKFLLILLTALMGMTSLTMSAQSTVTVADGSTTNSFVPVYGFYVDDFVRCQTIYPAGLLTGLNGETILGLTYYLSSPAADSWGAANFVVNIMEVTDTALTAFLDMTNATTVYSGSLDGTQSTMVIEFTVPYTYQGGNLLVEIYNTLEGTYKSASFYGITAAGASWQGNNGTSVADITGSAQNFIPKTTFTYGNPPTCFKVTNQGIDASQTTDNSLTLTWADALNTGATYSIYNMSDTTLIQDAVNGTSFTISGLNANTAYSFGIMTDCGGGDIANGYAIVNGRTACGIQALPWTSSFEQDELQGTTNALGLPWCTERYVSVAATSGTTYPYSYTSYPHTGNRSLYFYGTTGSAYPDTMAFIMPLIDVTIYPMNGNRLVFWGRSSSTSYDKTVYVYTLSNAADITSATLVDSVVISGTTYTKHSVPLTAATATDPYLAIMVMKGSGSLYLDDFTLEVMPSCLEVTNLTVTATTTNSISLSWDDAINPGATYTIYDMSNNTVVGTSTTTSYIVENLDANTLYTFGVQANCSAGDAPTTTISGRTDCDLFAAPYTWTFEDMTTSAAPICWTKIGSGSANVLSSTSNSHSGSLYVRFSGATSNLIALPETQAEIGTLQLRFWTRPESFTNANCGNFSVGYITDVTNDSTFVEVANYVYSDFSAYDEKTVTFAGAPAGARMAMRHNAGSTAWYWFIDDVTIEEAPACLPVSGLNASDITTTGATLNWTGVSSSYLIYDMSDTSLVATVSTDSYDLTGLTAMTSYTYGVAADCGNDLSPIAVLTFNTACDAIDLPYTETFEATSGTRDCWDLISNNTANIGGSNGMGFFTINNRETLRFSSYSSATDYNQYGFSPLMNIPADATNLGVSITFATYNTNDILNFGYVTATDTVWYPDDYFTTGNSDWQTIDLIVPTTAVKLAIHYYGSYSYYGWIDTVAVTAMTGDYCYPVSALAVDNATSSSVSLSWSDEYNSGATYTIYNMADTSIVASGVTGTSYDVTGLTDMTSYTFGVVANCSATETSNMTTVDAITTCAGETCNITIVGADSFGDGWNGNTISIIQSGLVIGTFTIESGSTLTETFAVCSGAPVSFSWTTGSYATETSFEILDGGGTTVYSVSDGSSLTSGEFFTLNDACPSCVPASALTVDAYSETTVTISWTGTAPSYDIYNGENFVANVTTNSYTFTGLTSGTDYTFGVQAICSATDSASMTTISVMTDCPDVTVLPYNEGFENGLGCWSTVNGSADGNPWNAQVAFSSGAITPHTGDGMAASWSWNNSAMHADAWLISPKFALPNTTDSLIFSWWENTNPNYQDSYSVVLSTTTQDTAAFTTVVYPYTAATGGWTKKSIDLSAYAGQTIRLAFHHVDYDKNYLLIDDIALTQVGGSSADVLHVTLTINNPALGTITPAPGNYDLALGESLPLNATPNAGANFDGWRMIVGGMSIGTLPVNPYTLTVNANLLTLGELTVMAVFTDSTSVPDSLTIILNTADATMGTTNPAPGVHSYAVGEQSVISAVPNPGYSFLYWIESATINGMTMSDTLTAQTVSMVVPSMYANMTLNLTAYFEVASGEPCNAPTGVTVSAFDDQSISLAWDANANVESWNVRYRTLSGDWTTVVANTNSYTITGLAANTTYQIQVQANCGEDGLSQWSAIITQATTSLNSYLENNVTLYPNPAKEYVDIRVNNLNVKSMEVYDVYGKLINTVTVFENPTRINVSNLANGMYFVRVTTEAGVVTKSFIKK